MENELLTIAKLMNDFSEKYNCRIDVETFECRCIGKKEAEIVYRLKAVKPELTKLEVIS